MKERMSKLNKKITTNVAKGMNYIHQKKWQAYILLSSVLMGMNTTNVYAAGAGTTGATSADAKWNAVIGFIVPWITRLGGAVVLIGAVEWGLAFKNDDAEGKTKGMRTLIAGCIVTAVGLSSNLFLN